MAEEARQLNESIDNLEKEFREKLKQLENREGIEELRLEYLGKKGRLTGVLKGLGKVSPEERGPIGARANKLKKELEESLVSKGEELLEKYYATLADKEWVDMTLQPQPVTEFKPGGSSTGSLHPVTKAQQRLEDIFTSMGFSVLDGPEVETDFYNFGALNFTDDHPAREMQDTFYTTENFLLRTHTSPVQVRAMQRLKPPMRIVVPGRVFRYEELDASHEHTFYQMEGMIIEENISISHLVFLMKTLLREVFEKDVEVRLRPGYFPFVEPGFELDMRCLVCGGEGCPVCKKSGWVEVLPCGLVHPNVLKAGGIDPAKWQGAAFGLGLSRLVMMEHAIEDIRHMQGGNPAFLRQF